MIKRFVVLRRKRGMNVKDFRKYWKEIHGQLIKKNPGIKKYIQYHVRSEINDDAEDPIDGIKEALESIQAGDTFAQLCEKLETAEEATTLLLNWLSLGLIVSKITLTVAPYADVNR